MATIPSKVWIALLCLFAMSFWANCNAADNKTKQPSYKMMPPPFCYGGVPGMHGKPGSPGIPGRDGRDGREGAKGDQGIPGNTGPQGPAGPSGTPGANGKDGAKGKAGESGTSGTPGTPGLMAYKNWKECAWKHLNDGRDHGLIKDCVFTKNFSDTTLHVYWTGTLRVHGCTGCCKRWYFTFNGAECSAPLPIDGIVYLDSKSQNPHRVRHIEGHCNSIHKGKVRVGFWVGKCAGYSGNVDAYTGYLAVSRIFVEEVPKPQA